MGTRRSPAPARQGQTEQAFIRQMGDVLTPEVAGSSLVELVRDEADLAPAYLLGPAGLQVLSSGAPPAAGRRR